MILPYAGTYPSLDASALILPSAVVIGDVAVGAESSLWFNVVARGDVNFIRIGRRTNIQDGSMIHVTHQRHPTRIGDEVTVGHSVTLHGCTIGDRCLIGIGAIVLDGAQVGPDVLVAAGSVITPGTAIPEGTLAMGSPARPKRDLTAEELASLRRSAANYVAYLESYRAQPGTAGRDPASS